MKKIKLLLAAIAAMVTMGVNAQTWTGNDVAAGDFYLYNVGAGQWLTSGNNWGTRASLTSAGGFCITLEGSESTFSMKVTETRTNNKAAGPGYVGTGGYMDSENAENWTFTKVEQGGVTAYRITSGDNALKYSGSGTVVDVGADATDNSLWVLVSKQDRLDAMAAADADHPVDATFLLKNPDFGRYKLPAYDAAWTWTFYGSGTNHNNSGDNTNFCVESYHQQFDYSQAVADAPYGNYGVRCQAFYRQDGSNNTDLPYVYVNEAKANFPAKTGSEGSMSDASNSFTAGNYWSDEAKTTFAGGTLTVGTHLENNTSLWCIWDNIQLKYYGPIDLSEFETQLAAAVSAAQAYETQLPTAVYTNIANVITEQNKTWSTADEYSAAITAINNAVSTYATAAIIADYARYKNIRTAVLAINGTIDVTAANTAVDAATSTDDIDAAVVTLRAAFLAELPNVTVPTDPGYIDVTSVMVDNAGVHTNTDYWTIANLSSSGGNAGVCNYGECEFYDRNFKFYQTLALTPGTWEFGVTGFHRAGNHNTHFYAGADQILIPGVERSVVNDMAGAKTYFDNGNGKVALKFLIESAQDIEIGINNEDTETDKWTIFRDFTLKYYGAPDYSVYDDRLAELAEEAATYSSKIPAPAYTVLNNVVTENNKKYTKKDDYIAAIGAIEAAIDNAKSIQTTYEAFSGSLSVRTKAMTTANLEQLAANDKTTLEGAIMTADEALKNCATLEDLNATITSQNANLWTAIGVAINTIGLSGDEKLNLTYLLTNPDVTGMGNGKKDGWYNDQNQPVQNSQAMTTNTSVANSADNTKYAMYEYWSYNTEATNGFTVYQKVTLPEGTYQMNALCFAGYGGGAQYSSADTKNITFSANDIDGTKIMTSTLEDASIEFVQTEAGEVKIGLKAHEGNTSNWMGIGYVQFYKVAAKTIEISENADYTPASAAGTVELTRTIKADNWNTFVVPFQISNDELKAAFGNDVAVAEFSDAGESADAVTVSFNTMATPAITPNKPVLLKTPTEGTSYTFNGRTIAEGEAKVAGTYVDFVGTYDASTTVADGDYFISGNKLWKSSGSTTIKGTRAYIDAKNTSTVKLFIDGITTDIRSIDNGQMTMDNEAIYTIAGQRVQKAQKGLYIINGKKVAVR